MKSEELPLVFRCRNQTLIGILHKPAQYTNTGMVLVVGGPQYRIGSHRQFVLLARSLAGAGIPVLRFDYRAMGDSEGDYRDFEGIGEDIAAAIDLLLRETGSLQRVVLWGLCDAASAALFYGHTDARIAGLVLVNPWVRTQAGEARTYLRHYYIRRLLDPAFWKKLLSGKLQLLESLRDLVNKLRLGYRNNAGSQGPAAADPDKPLPDRMADGLELFRGRVLVILSENDYVADEFRDLIKGSARWGSLLARDNVVRQELAEANHTFSQRDWRDRVTEWTRDWIQSL